MSQEFSPIVVVHPPMTMDITEIQRPYHHNVLSAIAYHLKAIGRNLDLVTPQLQSLMDHMKASFGSMPSLTVQQEDLLQAYLGNQAEFQKNFTEADNLILVDEHLYASRLYTMTTPASNETEAFQFVEATSILIGATVNKIIRRLEAERGVTTKAHAVVTTLTEEPAPVPDTIEPESSYSPILLEARLINNTWWVLAVVLDDVEAKPDPAITSALAIVREAIDAVWSNHAPRTAVAAADKAAEEVPVT